MLYVFWAKFCEFFGKAFGEFVTKVEHHMITQIMSPAMETYNTNRWTSWDEV